jgi:hypothetical protein
MPRVVLEDTRGKKIENPDLGALREATLSISPAFWLQGSKSTVELDYFDDHGQRKSWMIILPHENAYYLNVNRGTKGEFVSLSDRNKLTEVVECGDDWEASRGIFIPPEQAWLAIEEFLRTGQRTDKIGWLSTADMPYDGRW